MRYTQTFIPTVKEVPAEAEIPSHQLMIRAGYIRKLASGTYTYMPLGWRSLLKIVAIVREEMNAAGALEISMPVVAFVAGRFVDSMPGVRFGHAATIVEGERGSAKGKIERFKKAGIEVAESFSDIVPILKDLL